MNILFILLFMIFMHLVADYSLQGCLSNLKCRSYWLENGGDAYMYKDDYKMALLCHSFEWAFCVMLPIAIASGFSIGLSFIIVFAFNVIFHFIIDNLKANERKINLIIDQLLHLLQIGITFWFFTIGVIL